MEEADADLEVGPGPALPGPACWAPGLRGALAPTATCPSSLPRVQSFPQSSPLDQQIVRTLMSYALTVWAAESGLRFREVDSQQEEADILIGFAQAYHQDSYPFDGLGGTLAHAFFPGEHPISGDTHFDDEEIWTFGSQGKASRLWRGPLPRSGAAGGNLSGEGAAQLVPRLGRSDS